MSLPIFERCQFLLIDTFFFALFSPFLRKIVFLSFTINNTIFMDTFIIDGIRTPIGNFGGTLAPVRTDDLGAIVLKELISRNQNVPTEQIADVIMGCANQAGEDNRNVARMSALLAGLPWSVPGETVNRLCAS